MVRFRQLKKLWEPIALVNIKKRRRLYCVRTGGKVLYQQTSCTVSAQTENGASISDQWTGSELPLALLLGLTRAI